MQPARMQASQHLTDTKYLNIPCRAPVIVVELLVARQFLGGELRRLSDTAHHNTRSGVNKLSLCHCGAGVCFFPQALISMQAQIPTNCHFHGKTGLCRGLGPSLGLCLQLR